MKSLIVGAHFRPPAKVLLTHVPAGTEVVLEPEPENPYDEFAVKVLIKPESIPESEHEALRDECASMGHDWDELLALGEPIHVGFCIAATNKKLGAWTPNTEVGEVLKDSAHRATLGFSDKGEAFVKVERAG